MNNLWLSHVRAPLAVVLLVVGGCGDGQQRGAHALQTADLSEDDATPAPLMMRPPPAAPAPDTHPGAPPAREVKLETPDVTIRVSSTASGTACEKRQVSSDLSSDGSQLLTTYGWNELFKDGKTQSETRACFTRIAFETSAPVQFSIERFLAQGYAYMEDGVEGFADFSIHDDAGLVGFAWRDFSGPSDGAFRVDEPVGGHDGHWSPCSRTGVITLRNVFGVTSHVPNGAGYVDMCATDAGHYDARVAMKLAWRACTPHARSVGRSE